MAKPHRAHLIAAACFIEAFYPMNLVRIVLYLALGGSILTCFLRLLAIRSDLLKSSPPPKIPTQNLDSVPQVSHLQELDQHSAWFIGGFIVASVAFGTGWYSGVSPRVIFSARSNQHIPSFINEFSDMIGLQNYPNSLLMFSIFVGILSLATFICYFVVST